MISEQLSPDAVKLTLTPEETAELPPPHCREPLRRYIRGIADRIRAEGRVTLPEGRLLAEIYMISDGSSVIFISVIEPRVAAETLYACDLSGADSLIGLINAISDSGAVCSVYCGSDPRRYRVIIVSPPPELRRICREYGECCEISRLFAAETAEYLTAVAECCPADVLQERLCGGQR